MRVLESRLKESILETFSLRKGTIYVFDNFIITEFNEGAVVDEECFLRIYQVLDIYGDQKPNYGLISNRVNSYAVNTSDFLKVSRLASRKYKSAIVVYDDMTARSALFERQIYKCWSPTYYSLDEAVSWILKDREISA